MRALGYVDSALAGELCQLSSISTCGSAAEPAGGGAPSWPCAIGAEETSVAASRPATAQLASRERDDLMQVLRNGWGDAAGGRREGRGSGAAPSVRACARGEPILARGTGS